MAFSFSSFDSSLSGSLGVHIFFFLNDTATTEIYTLSLHDALPISCDPELLAQRAQHPRPLRVAARNGDRKSTRLNSSHTVISYAVFCLKKKKNKRPYDPSYRKKNHVKQS